MSTHAINIIEIKELLAHENADKLEIVKINGWQSCVRKGDFKIGDRAIFIEPDYIVDTSRPEFSFLSNKGNHVRIKVSRLRGVLSQGLLIPVPNNLKHLPVGHNVISDLEIIRYEPPESYSTSGDNVSGPSKIYFVKFDIENIQRYGRIFQPGEEVVVTEKIHGTNSRFVFAKNKNDEYEQFVGSRTNWKKESNDDLWWKAAQQNPQIFLWCQNNPDKILYGEVFGQVQNLKYGARVNQLFFAAFAVMYDGKWQNYDDMVSSLSEYGVPLAPEIFRGPFDYDKIISLAENDSIWPGANHMSEGVVIRPVIERDDPLIGRVALKAVSTRYLS